MKKSFTIIILSILILFSCNKKEKNISSNINIDSKIKENTIFRKLNDSLEFNFNKRDSIGAKRSSNINFEITINDTITRVTELKAKSSFLNTYYFGKENEQIQTKKSDTLVVYIDNSDGYSSEGIKILVNKDNYDIKYFMTSDVILPNRQIELTKINSSKLILDKKNYNVNDSIFGYLEANLTYQNIFSLPQHIKTKGYFRTKIKENNY